MTLIFIFINSAKRLYLNWGFKDTFIYRGYKYDAFN